MNDHWVAMEALRTVINRGFDYRSVRVWFVGNHWAEARCQRPGYQGHLEVLFPARLSNVDAYEEVQPILVDRVNAALDRQIGACL